MYKIFSSFDSTFKTQSKMKKLVNINGQLIETRLFKTRQAAQNFQDKGSNRQLVFMKAGQYFVSI